MMNKKAAKEIKDFRIHKKGFEKDKRKMLRLSSLIFLHINSFHHRNEVRRKVLSCDLIFSSSFPRGVYLSKFLFI